MSLPACTLYQCHTSASVTGTAQQSCMGHPSMLARLHACKMAYQPTLKAETVTMLPARHPNDQCLGLYGFWSEAKHALMQQHAGLRHVLTATAVVYQISPISDEGHAPSDMPVASNAVSTKPEVKF